MYEKTKARIRNLRKYYEGVNKADFVGFVEYAEGGCYAYTDSEKKRFFAEECQALDSLQDCSVVIVIDV